MFLPTMNKQTVLGEGQHQRPSRDVNSSGLDQRSIHVQKPYRSSKALLRKCTQGGHVYA
jgi:hypothetical protein